MSVVKINAIDAPAEMSEELERRFASRAGSVEQAPGFEEFLLLRPVEGESRYFVYTRWDSEESYQQWVNSRSFAANHASAAGAAKDQAPVSRSATLLGFEVVQRVTKGGGSLGQSGSF